MPDAEEPKAKEPLSVFDLIAFSLDQFSEVAWQKMGLRPDPLTGQIKQDMEQAKVAIDMAARLAEALDPHLEGDDRRRIQNLMSDLRINYVRKSEAGGSPETGEKG